MDLSPEYLISSTISVTDIRATLPYTAWPHRVDVGREVPRGEHHFSSGQPLFDLSSGSFPTGLLQDPEVDLPATDFKPKSELDARIKGRCECSFSFASVTHPKDVPEDARNGPIGLQITARRLEEEKVVDMLCKVKDALSK
jgi:amidase